MAKDKDNIHQGHRNRTKEQFKEHGLDAFADHEALELLLYSTIPRKDTNPIGHALMERFGSISAVMDAGYEELLSVEGIGEQTAINIMLVSALGRRAALDRMGKRPMLNICEKAAEYGHGLFYGAQSEKLYMLCLDAQCYLRKTVLIGEGTIDRVPFYVRKLVEEALRYNAANVILMHNHPAGGLRPSRDDIEVTEKAMRALATIEITLFDHLIIAETGFYSFVRNAHIKRGLGGDISYAAELEE
ncbi:DNA repair protein RadC [Eubacteriales bacterium OttesenSCG-928-N14]|nr:DNA repair protein RadC [Eubacteriales bacterium OttesenSCG-928-N14]